MLACGCLLFSSFAATQEQDDPLTLLYGDEETVSIATGTKKPLRLAPSVASVITAEDIKAMGAQTLDEVLEAVPGVHVSLSSRYSSLISIRGVHTRLNPQVLMLIDGYPISELFTGSRAPTFSMPVKNIDRVEVIRGPGSAVYGADAFAGVINIITKGPDTFPALEAGTQAGSFDTHGAWVQGSGEWLGWRLGLGIEGLKSEGDQDRLIKADLQSALDAIFGSSASQAPSPASTHYDITDTQLTAIRPHWKLALNSWTQDEGGIGAGISEALDPQGYQDVSQQLLQLNYGSEQLYENWHFTGTYSYFRLRQRSHYTIFPRDATLPIGDDGNLNFTPGSSASLVHFPDGLRGNPGGVETHSAVELAVSFTGLESHHIRIAGGYKNQHLDTFESKNFGPGVMDIGMGLVDVSDTQFIYLQDRSRQIQHISLQDEWLLYRDWELTAGVRYDEYSDFGSTINPRFALVWQASYRLTSKLLYGHAFRAPSFLEQFAINNPVTLGNPEIDPEETDTIELVFDYRPAHDLKTKLSLFRYDIDGLIDFVDANNSPGGSSVARNVHDQSGYGLELEASWRATDTLSLVGSYSFQRSKNQLTGELVPDAPRQLAHLDLRWRVSPNWTLASQLRHVADRGRAKLDPRSEVGDYSLVDLTIRNDVLLSFADLKLSIANVFDTEAREPSAGPLPSIPHDHPLEGRRILLEAVFRID
jgi:outer membrane receptor for ferrienterochelin and colicins